MKMIARKETAALIAALLLCMLSLMFSVALQRAGYLTYLNSDMASEVILARRQYEMGRPVLFDWLYSTEVHTVHMNLLYALAFNFTSSYRIARILGNTWGFLIGMGVLYVLLRRLHVSRAPALASCALLPFAASALYASNMTIGGYYIIHLPFGFGMIDLFLGAREGKRGRTIGLVMLCFLMGLLSVRYVVCFVCPLLAATLLPELLSYETPKRMRSLRLGLLAFVCCAAGYIMSEVLVPRFFVSGTGAASSFTFVPLDGDTIFGMLRTVFADSLKLLGWRGEVPLFSAAGIVNLLTAVIVTLGILLFLRASHRYAKEGETNACLMLRFSVLAFGINLFCFLFLQGAYLNRYIVLAAIFFVPCVPLLLTGEKNALLRRVFVLVLVLQLLLSGAVLYRSTMEQERANEIRGADLKEAGDFLLSEGYTAGYGTFWNIRVLEERTQGQLTFTGIVPAETEEGAPVPMAPSFIRWLEPNDRSNMDHVPGKTFLLLTHDEEKQLSAWLAFANAVLLHRNETFTIYGIESGEMLVSAMLFGRSKLNNAEYKDGIWHFSADGRLRIPTSWLDAGDYEVTFSSDSQAEDAKIRSFYTASFICLAEQPLVAGENRFSFTLPSDDKYFILLIEAGKEKATLSGLSLSKSKMNN